MSSVEPHYNQHDPIYDQGPLGSNSYCIAEGEIPHVETNYPYKKVKSDQQFRLLKLFPQSYEPPLVRSAGISQSSHLYGSLSDHDLTEQVSYDCLSYVWGAPETQCVLWLDTYMVGIGENLDGALRSLQHKTEPRMVWVDFVCINQDDHAERKQQVELMYRLYAKAKKVVAYLGDEADGSEQVPALLERILAAFSADFTKYKDSQQEILKKPWGEADRARLGLPAHHDPAWSCLRHFLSRPWFIRVWIMQEAIAATQLVFNCGLWTSPAAEIVMALKIGFAKRLPFIAPRSEAKTLNTIPVVRGQAHLTLLIALGLGQTILAEDNSLSLIDILERSRHASCTGPRDRVFALLNISNDKPPLGLRPDYTSTVSDTYRYTARALVATGQGHRLLQNVWMSESESNLKLPSWVPDWSLFDVPMDTISPLATPCEGEKVFGAGGTDHSFHLGENPDELVVQAFSIGNIYLLKDVFEYEAEPPPCPLDIDTYPPCETGAVSEASEDKLSKYPVIFRVFVAIHSYLEMSSSPLYQDKDKEDIIWRTMICDRELGSQFQAPQAFDCYFWSYMNQVSVLYGLVHPFDHMEKIKAAVLSSSIAPLIQSEEQLHALVIQQDQLQRQQYLDFQAAASKFGNSMRVCMTNTGIIGMVPRFSEEEDEVVVIKGVNVPLVLRREGDNRYKVVGQAYFWGLMNGEVLRMDGVEEEEIVLI